MTYFEKSLITIELPEVLKMLSDQAVSEAAKEEAAALAPSVSAAEVRRRIDETSAARKMMLLRGSPSFASISDVRASLSRADLGGVLSPVELLRIADVLECARRVKNYIAEAKDESTCIDYLFHSLRANRYLEEKINTSIPSEDEIADSASAELATIRRQMRAASARVRDALQKIISSPSYAKALQDSIITMRSDRYVVPVKIEYKSLIPGLVHDISSSGATVFIEPMGAVKANNELRELAAREKKEIERILAELSAECAEHAEDIVSDFNYLVRLDLIFAKAKLSYKMDGVEAQSSEKGLYLHKARHPLLDSAKVVPITVELGDSYDTLVITGPNTGGKTVTLKTIGLLAAMNQCGLHIPAGDGSTLPVYERILADIGDEQSIQQNLSTFSSHMNNIVRMTEECDDNTLVLFDELGAGTDPVEGAALAIAIIEYIRAKGATVVATTHYSELKVYATNEHGVQNASCEFDIETLKPTYRLIIGIPGKSNAFAISSRIGLPQTIIEDAKTRIGSDNATFEATIEKLEQTRLNLEQERETLRLKLRTAEEERVKAARIRAELEVRLEKADVKARRDADRIITEAKETAEKVFAELDEMRRQANEEEDAARINEARSQLRRTLNESYSAPADVSSEIDESEQPGREIVVGDSVKIKSMGMVAEVVSISADATLQLQAGPMKISAAKAEVVPVDRPGKKPGKAAPKKAETTLRTETVEARLDLRGMDSIDAVIAAEQYIDNAVMGRLSEITIIHGKGTGALRNAIQQMLRKNRHVKSFRLGRFGEGETGVTVVELK